jgi:hypothetical protein
VSEPTIITGTEEYDPDGYDAEANALQDDEAVVWSPV